MPKIIGKHLAQLRGREIGLKPDAATMAPGHWHHLIASVQKMVLDLIMLILLWELLAGQFRGSVPFPKYLAEAYLSSEATEIELKLDASTTAPEH